MNFSIIPNNVSVWLRTVLIQRKLNGFGAILEKKDIELEKIVLKKAKRRVKNNIGTKCILFQF